MQPEPLVELSLYVSATSAASIRVRALIERVLGEFDASRVRLEVLDVARDVKRAEEDRVVFTPTLVKRRPAPPAWFVGEAGSQMVAVVLASCGVERIR